MEIAGIMLGLVFAVMMASGRSNVPWSHDDRPAFSRTLAMTTCRVF